MVANLQKTRTAHVAPLKNIVKPDMRIVKRDGLTWAIPEGDMGGSEYRNTAYKIEQTPHHRKKYYQYTDTAKFTWSKCFFFFFLTSISLLLIFKHKKHITRHSYRILRM